MAAAGFWARLTRGDWRTTADPHWIHATGVDHAQRTMSLAVTDRFYSKQGRSTGRVILGEGADRLCVYIKRHFQLPRWLGWLATLWPGGNWSPAMAEWQHLVWARRHGIPVPEPLAVGECIGPWGRLASYLVIRELGGMLPLHEAVPLAAATLPALAFAQWKRATVHEMARLTRLLHAARRYHKDLYLCHFFAKPADAEQATVSTGSVHMIDFHRLGHHPWLRWHWQIKDLAQLLYSSLDVTGITNRDRVRFFRLYAGSRRRKLLHSVLRHAVLLKASRYQRHNRTASPAKPALVPPPPGRTVAVGIRTQSQLTDRS